MIQNSVTTSEFLDIHPFFVRVKVITKDCWFTKYKNAHPWGVNFYKTKPCKSEAQTLLLSCPWYGLRFIPGGPDVPDSSTWNKKLIPNN